MKIFRHFVHYLLMATLVFAPALSLVSASVSAADLPACHKDMAQNGGIESNKLSGQVNLQVNNNSDSANHDDCSSQCGMCFTCLKLPVNQIRLHGPTSVVSKYIQLPEFFFRNISPQQEPRPPRLV